MIGYPGTPMEARRRSVSRKLPSSRIQRGAGGEVLICWGDAICLEQRSVGKREGGRLGGDLAFAGRSRLVVWAVQCCDKFVGDAYTQHATTAMVLDVPVTPSTFGSARTETRNGRRAPGLPPRASLVHR